MSLEDIIANYIAQQRSLGKRYSAEVKILAAFRLSVSDVRLRDIRPEMISRFVERGGTSDETRSKKFRVLSGLFLFAVTRHQLRTSPMPQRPRKRTYSSYVPYIYSEAELKRLLAAVPTATANSRYVIDADTLRALLLLLYGAGLRRGEALRLKDQRRRHLAITHTHSRNQVLQDTHRPPERQSEHRHTDVHRKTG